MMNQEFEKLDEELRENRRIFDNIMSQIKVLMEEEFCNHVYEDQSIRN